MMLNTQKLLYILPDLAYIAELVPDKKPHSFSIQSFKQINGEFFKSNKLIPEHVAKLFSKLQADEAYTIILPDFLFTNTIVGIEETTEAKVKSRLQEDVLDELKLTPDSHLIETTSLNQLKGTTRVQISAIDKTLLEVLQVAVAEKDIRVDAVVPLSWSVKSLISLEPSISILQLGERLYGAQHYIGVDQASDSKTSDTDKIIETIKTLKGAEPSIQTVYLLTDNKVEKELKTGLKDIIPLQQMTSKSSGADLPNHVKAVIESALKTLSISDFPAPKFELERPDEKATEKYAAIFAEESLLVKDSEGDEQDLPKPSSLTESSSDQGISNTAGAAVATAAGAAALSAAAAAPKAAVAGDIRTDVDMPAKKSTDTQKDEVVKEQEIEEITPTTDGEQEDKKESQENEQAEGSKDRTDNEEKTDEKIKKADTAEKDSTDNDKEENKSQDDVAPVVVGASASKEGADAPEISVSTDDESTDDKKSSDERKEKREKTEEETTAEDDKKDETQNKTTLDTAEIDTPEILVGAGQTDEAVIETGQESVADADEIDLSQFTQSGAETPVASSDDKTAADQTDETKRTIKNNSGVNKMLKMILITTGVFILTVAIGIGAGMAILKYSNQNTQPTPEIEVEETPIIETTPEPTEDPAATESADIAKEEMAILVVNATTKVGYAGTVSTEVEDAGFTDVTTGNAKGDYKEGNYIYMADENQAVIDELSEATGLELKMNEDVAAEDSADEYDVVVVLAE